MRSLLINAVMPMLIAMLAMTSVFAPIASAQQLLEGEFGDIQLGRELIEPNRVPTIQQLRAAVRENQIRFVLMLKLHGDDNNQHLPVWSHDGRRLAFQSSRTGKNESKLLLFEEMSQPQPTLLTSAVDAYDYMFRWGVNGDGGYAFTRIHGSDRRSDILVAERGRPPQVRTSGDGNYLAPALYRRTDGIWRLAYEHQGQLEHEAWNADGPAQAAVGIGPGTGPRWSQDGYRLLMARQVRGSGRVGVYQVTVHNLRSKTNTVVPLEADETLRSPSWSPTETAVAYFSRSGRDGSSWRIRSCSLKPPLKPIALATDVVVNPDFTSEGPSWEPSGERVWCFSHRHRDQAYYPLLGVALDGASVVVDYPRRCTTPKDLAANPHTTIPELAFVGNVGLRQELFVVFLNHY